MSDRTPTEELASSLDALRKKFAALYRPAWEHELLERAAARLRMLHREFMNESEQVDVLQARIDKALAIILRELEDADPGAPTPVFVAYLATALSGADDN